MTLNRQQKEKLVIGLLNQDISVPKIGKQAHMSFSDIKRIREKVTGDDKEEKDKEAEKEKRQSPFPARRLVCFWQRGFRCRWPSTLDLETERVVSILYDFMRLQNMHKAATILKEYKGHLAPFVKMFEWQRKNNTRGKDIRYVIEMINNIVLEQQKDKLKKEV